MLFPLTLFTVTSFPLLSSYQSVPLSSLSIPITIVSLVLHLSATPFLLSIFNFQILHVYFFQIWNYWSSQLSLWPPLLSSFQSASSIHFPLGEKCFQHVLTTVVLLFLQRSPTFFLLSMLNFILLILHVFFFLVLSALNLTATVVTLYLLLSPTFFSLHTFYAYLHVFNYSRIFLSNLTILLLPNIASLSTSIILPICPFSLEFFTVNCLRLGYYLFLPFPSLCFLDLT